MLKILGSFIFCCTLALSVQVWGATAQPAPPAPLVPSLPAPMASAGQFLIYMSSVYPSSHPVVQEVLLPWAEYVRNESGDRLIIRFFPPDSLVESERMGRAVRLGQLGLGFGLLDIEPESFRLGILAAQQPGQLDLKQLSIAYWRMFTEIPELAAEFEGIKLLAFCASAPSQLCMAKKQIYDVKSLRGLRFLVPSHLVEQQLLALQTLPSIVPQTDFKMYMEDKIADGLFLSSMGIFRLNLQDSLENIGVADLQNEVLWLGMHQGAWDMLPQDLRNLLARSTGLALSQRLGEHMALAYRSSLDECLAAGIKVHYFSAEERANFYASLHDVSQAAWQELSGERNFNAQQLQNKIAKIMHEAKVR